MAAKERRFNFHWGSGVVAEESRFEGEWHNPAIQLLRYDEGDMAGITAVRFCFFNDNLRIAVLLQIRTSLKSNNDNLN